MGFVSALAFAQKLAAERLQPGEPAVDATAGTGVDTLFLAKRTGPKGLVYAFDIQAEALKRTKVRLDRDPGPLAEVRLLRRSHHEMADSVLPSHHGNIAAVMFNLGYLPGGDESVVTREECTLPALATALTLLRRSGILTIMVYPGHPGGREEAEAVAEWASRLSQDYDAMTYRFLNRPDMSSYLIAVVKR